MTSCHRGADLWRKRQEARRRAFSLDPAGLTRKANRAIRRPQLTEWKVTTERRSLRARLDRMDGETAARYRKEGERVRQEAKAISNVAIRQQLLAVAASYDGRAETVLIIARQRESLSD